MRCFWFLFIVFCVSCLISPFRIGCTKLVPTTPNEDECGSKSTKFEIFGRSLHVHSEMVAKIVCEISVRVCLC